MDSVERVKNMVRHTLVVKPEVTNRELLARAMEIAPDAVEGLSLRQFHGRFRLPIMRFELGARRRSKATTAKVAGANGSATSSTGSESTAVEADETKPRQAKSRRSTTRRATPAGTPAVDTAVRDILVEFAVELEKAESRSDLVQVMGGVHTFVGRITAVASDYYNSPKGKKPSEN